MFNTLVTFMTFISTKFWSNTELDNFVSPNSLLLLVGHLTVGADIDMGGEHTNKTKRTTSAGNQNHDNF